MIDKKRLIGLTRKLISLNSENPPGDEHRIAVFVNNYLNKLGLKSRIYEFKERRSNVIAVLEGKGRKNRSLLISPHLDTVPRGRRWHFDPFAGEIHKGRIYGLGATDCKGNLAVCLEVMNNLVEEREILDYNLLFAATADEESGSLLGVKPLLDKGILKPDAALILDADDYEIIVAQKGLIHIRVKIEGKKAHGAYPWLGINAIDIAADIIIEAGKYKFTVNKNKYLMPPSINVGTIRGGDKVNVVADWCEFELDFRFLPGDSAGVILKKFKDLLRNKAGKFKIEIESIQRPFQIDESSSLVGCLKKSMVDSNIKPKIRGSEGATIISFFQDKGIPSLATGFGVGGCAHKADEYVEINNLYNGAKVLQAFLKSYKFS